MYVFETVTTSEREVRRISTAFYRFLEGHLDDAGSDAAMHIDRSGAAERVRIRLWSEGAVEAYRRYLDAFTVPPPKAPPLDA